jgi:hypothetical protein
MSYLFTPLLERGRLTLVATTRKGNPPWLPCRWLALTVNSYEMSTFCTDSMVQLVEEYSDGMDEEQSPPRATNLTQVAPDGHPGAAARAIP